MCHDKISWLTPILCLLALPAGAQAETYADMPRIVVTATRTAIQHEDVPSGYSEVTREDIDRIPAATLADLLQDLPGFAIDHEQDGRSQISVRGLSPAQTLLLINGRRVNNTDELVGHSDFRLTQIPTAAIERIEVIRGPLSSLYGADALGGVINVITRPPGEAWTGRAQARLGTTHPRNGGTERNLAFYTAGPLGDKAGVMLSVDYLDRDGSLNPDEPTGIDEIEAREALSSMASLFYRPAPGHELEFFFNASDDKRRARRGTADTRRLDIFRYSTGGRYDFRSSYWNSRIDVYRSRGRSEALHLDREEQHTDDVVDLSASRLWGGGNHELTVGTDYRRESFWRDRVGEREMSDKVSHRAALVQNRSYFLDRRLIVALSARYDDHTNYSNEISPRAGVVYAFTDALRLKADYGRGFSAPDLRRASGTYDFTFTTRPLRIIGNPDLEPEHSDSYNLSLEYEAGGRRAAVTLFRNDIKDLIDLRCIEFCEPGGPPPGEEELRTYINVDRARTQGVEAEVGYRFDNGVQLRANYTYLDAFNRDTGETLERRPRQRFNFLAETELWPGASGHLRGEYTGSRRLGQVRARDYTLFHLGLSQALPNGFFLRAGVDNLTDQRLADIDEAYTNEIRGRFYYATVNWEF